MEQLRGRNALMTGAAGGIAGYIARALAVEGVNLALSDLPETPPQELLDELGGRIIDVEAVPANLADRTELRSLPERAEEAIGPLDILINCAGLEFAGPYLERTEEEVTTLIEVNLTATMLLTKAVLPGMLERGRGHVVNIASMAGKVPSPALAAYSASKHGVIGFTHALRNELSDSPVSLSAICPGLVARAGMYGRVQSSEDPPPPMRPVEPEQVADAVVSAIRHDRTETIVNGPGTRPLILLAALAPGAFARLSRLGRIQQFADSFMAAKRSLPDTVAERKVHTPD